MCIEICDEVVDQAVQGNAQAISMLEKLALAIKYKKHLVFAQIDLLDKILGMAHLDAMSKSQYLKIKRKYSEIGQVYGLLNFRALVKMSGDNCRSKSYIFINASTNERLEVYEESHLLTENLLDGEFFEYLVDQYVKTKGVSWPICYMPQMGGGSTLAKVYEMEINRGQHFCLAILDSDKKWPTAQKGETWDKVRKVDKECYLGDGISSDGKYAYNCGYYVMEEVRELENLIPTEVLLSMQTVQNNTLLSMGIDLSFHDMKEGMLASKVKKGHYQSYLQTVYTSYSQILKYIDFLADYRDAFYSSSKDGFEKACGRWKLSEGMGSKIMEQVLINASEELKKADFTKLTAPQQHEWTNIGKTFFEWCCSFDGGVST